MANNSKFLCNHCDKILTTKQGYAIHLETHNPKRILFKCNICNGNFSLQSSLRRHEKLVHGVNGSGKFNCVFCAKPFLDSTGLENHTLSHTLERPFFCKLCPAEFSRKGNLTSHLQAVHKLIPERLHKCELCLKTFPNNIQLRIHIQRHTREKLYKCQACRKSFPTKHQLMLHNRTHSGERPFVCTHCPKHFSRGDRLNSHLLLHFNDNAFSCDLCQKRFTRKDYLKTHLFLHTGKKPCVCELCKKDFSQNGDLQRHIRTHTGEKAYKCKICNKAFSTSTYCKEHQKIHKKNQKK